MDICEAKEKWDGLSKDDRFKVLEEFTEQIIDELGYDSVEVGMDSLDDGAAGEWRYGENKIYYDEDALETHSLAEMVETVVHEVTHAADDFEAGAAIDYGEEKVTYYEKYTWVFSDAEDAQWFEGTVHPPGYEMDVTPEHLTVHEFADLVAEQFLADCKDEGDSQYGSEQNLPPGDWNLPGDTRVV